MDGGVQIEIFFRMSKSVFIRLACLVWPIFCLTKAAGQVAFTKIPPRPTEVKRADEPKIGWQLPKNSTDPASPFLAGELLDIAVRLEMRPDLPLSGASFSIFRDEEICQPEPGSAQFSPDGREFRATVKLPPGLHSLFIEMPGKGGLRARSARLFVKNEPSVKPVDFIWMEPDATEGGLKTVETDRFRFKIQLKTDGELKAAQVGLLLDGEFKPAREASLQRINRGYSYEDEISLSAGVEREIVVVAAGRRSPEMRLRFEPPRPKGKPGLFVLTVGPKVSGLKFTGHDATDLFDCFSGQAKGANPLYEKVISKKLTGADATTGRIKEELESLKKQINDLPSAENNVFVFQISTHGFLEKGMLRLQGSNFKKETPLTTSLGWETEILALIDLINCPKIVFLDACHSGQNGIKSSEIEPGEWLGTGMALFTSCQQKEVSVEDDAWKNGAFTEAILEGLKGKADAVNDKDRQITIGELRDFVRFRTHQLVQAKKNTDQTPTFDENLGSEGQSGEKLILFRY